MPPKRRVLTQDELKQQFQSWKLTEEYLQWQNCRQMLNELVKDPRGLTETTKDLTGDWYQYLDQIWKLFAVMKVKAPKIQRLQHQHVRSFFFGWHDDDDIIHYVDGIHSGVSKDAGQRAYHLRHKFIGIYKKVQDLPEFEPKDYQQMKKDLIGFMKEFIQFFQPHLKQKLGHAEIYEGRLFDVLQPLRNLIEKNMEYRIFVLQYKNELEQEVVHFKLKELEKQYAEYLQEVMRIICKESRDENQKPVVPPIDCMPPVVQIFYQLHYRYDDKNSIEQQFLDPLHENFLQLQKELCRLEYKGINYWKTPLWRNEEMVECIKNLIKSELICKALMGNELLREQINFIFNIMKIMQDADEQVYDNMTKEDENVIHQAAPLLIIFKSIQYMRKWHDTKIATEKKQAIERENLGLLKEMKAQVEEKSPLKEYTKQLEEKDKQNSMIMTLSPTKGGGDAKSTTMSPDKKTATGGVINSMMITKPVERLYQNETIRIPGKDLDSEELKYGRYFMLENYIDEAHRQQIEEAVELIRHINPAVQQDIQDYYIKEGITPQKKRGVKEDKDLKQAIKYLDQKNLEENANEKVKMVRPPELWNYPQIVEETHQFRTIADPKQSYIDGRIDHLHKIIEESSKNLTSYNAIPWNRLIRRIIQCFKGAENPEPQTELVVQEIQNYG